MRTILNGLVIVGILLLAALPALAQDSTPPAEAALTPSLRDVVVKYNICPTDLLAANRSILSADAIQRIEGMTPRFVEWAEVPANVVIPPHEMCYNIVTSSIQGLPRVEDKYNVCIEDFYQNDLNVRVQSGTTVESGPTWYLWRDAPPCVNEAGQRLQYTFDARGHLVKPVYNEVPFVEAPESLAKLDLCLNDLISANPNIRFNENNQNGIPFLAGMRLFVPEGTHHCRALEPGIFPLETLHLVSTQANVCIDQILEASDMMWWPLVDPVYFIPVDVPPCYDAEGKRLGVKIRETYTPQPTESFLEVALKYDVCLNDLWDANPIMITWYKPNDYWPQASLPDEILIPDTPSCADPMTYRVPVNQTLLVISALTNVCWNQLTRANPSISGGWGMYLPVGTTMTIPTRPHCWNLQRGGLQAHMCYPIPITADMDLTGHEPPISWSFDTDLPYCEQLADGMTVFYNNKPYNLYVSYGAVLVTLQCAQVTNLDDVYMVRMEFGQVIPWSDRFGRIYGNWLMIPTSHADCALLNMTRDERSKWAQDHYRWASLYEGVYIVGSGDTLSGIGHEFGYLPQWIADANGLTELGTLYPGQELRMPSFPSLYVLTSIAQIGGLFALIGGTVYGVRRWQMRRYMGKNKKKNEAA